MITRPDVHAVPVGLHVFKGHRTQHFRDVLFAVIPGLREQAYLESVAL